MLDHTHHDGFLLVESVPFRDHRPINAEKETLEFTRRAYCYLKIPRFLESCRIPSIIRRPAKRAALIVNARQRVVRFSINGFWRRNLIGFRTSDRWLNGRVLHKSSDWPILSRAAVKAVVDASQDARFIRRYRRTLNPSESFFATVLANSADVSLSEDDHRFLRWTGGPHPEILTTADFDELVASGDFFARKFDTTVDRRVLDLLDDHIDASRGQAP